VVMLKVLLVILVHIDRLLRLVLGDVRQLGELGAGVFRVVALGIPIR
jgi:hypothetical protein